MFERTTALAFKTSSSEDKVAVAKSNILLAFSCDLELSPEVRINPDLRDARLIKGFSRLVEIIKQTDIVCTFFTQGKLCEKYPEIVETAYNEGQEIGAHGYSHRPLGPAWWLESYPRSKSLFFLRDEIQRNKDAIYELLKENPLSFRAPYLRISKKTLQLVESAGFLFDSSIYNPGVNRLSSPYHPSVENPSLDGKLRIFEVPITVSVTPKRKFLYHRHPSLLELNAEELEPEITKYIQKNEVNGNRNTVFVPMVHPYEFCSDEYCSKVLLFIKIMKNINATSIRFIDFRNLLEFKKCESCE